MFPDTSGLLCYLHRDESQHADAVACFDSSGSELTHNFVIAEFVALASARRLPRAATLSFVSNLLEHPDVETIWVAEALYREALRILVTQLDKAYSLCDAISFLVMRDRGMTEALTTDDHFEQAGFTRLLIA